MMKKYLVLVLAFFLPAYALGQGPDNYRCTYGDLERRVEILREAGVSVPCEVHYYKDSEAPGAREVLWSATNEAGYCERKTKEFIAKLEGWGWNCGQGGEEPVAPEVADDTAALSTAEETPTEDAVADEAEADAPE